VKDQPAPIIDGDVVRRPAGPWTPAVHARLDHLERAGFTGSPHAVSAAGEDIVAYIPGESVDPHAWSDEGACQVGCLLRSLHDATAGFMPPPGATWHPWPFASDAPDAIISHRDTGPWNIVARDGLPVAFIDWVTAGPADPLEERAATAWLNAQLHDDDIAERPLTSIRCTANCSAGWQIPVPTPAMRSWCPRRPSRRLSAFLPGSAND
jgi:hypothetical protein